MPEAGTRERSSARMRALTPVLAALIAGCAGGADPEAGSVAVFDFPEWTVSAEPSVSIGVLEGEAHDQLHGVAGAAVLPGGRIAVLNAGSHELRIYDADGRFISAAGRAGAGPGEFRRPVRLHRVDDMLLVFDVGASRFSVHGPDGGFVAVEPVKFEPRAAALDEWIHDRSWIEGPPLGRGRAALFEGLRRLPPPDSAEGYRYIRVSRWGHMWVRQPLAEGAASREWHIYDLAGEPVARVRVPAAVDILEIGDDYLLVRARDELDVEYVRKHALDTGGRVLTEYAFGDVAPEPAGAAADDAVRTHAAAINDMRASLRMMNMAQEVHYAKPDSRYRYASDVAQLEDWSPPEGVTIRIVRATERGWTAIAVHDATGLVCGIGIGLEAPAGWTPGMALCQ